jgi:transposase-like protein
MSAKKPISKQSSSAKSTQKRRIDMTGSRFRAKARSNQFARYLFKIFFQSNPNFEQGGLVKNVSMFIQSLFTKYEQENVLQLIDEINVQESPTSLHEALMICNLDNFAFVQEMMRLGIIDQNSPQCECGRVMNLNKSTSNKDGAAWKCPSSTCRKSISVRHQTVFMNSKYSLKQCFMIYSAWAADYKLSDIAQLIGVVDTDAIGRLCHKFREIAVQQYEDDIQEHPLGGINQIVQVDEGAFGRAKYNKGRALKRHCNWVVGAVDASTRRVAVSTVEKRDSVTLNSFIEGHISSGSIIHTDKWRGYNRIGDQYTHQTVNHSKRFVEFVDGEAVHTQRAEGNWTSAKRSLRHHYAFKRARTDEYVKTWAFRRNIAPGFNRAFMTLHRLRK